MVLFCQFAENGHNVSALSLCMHGGSRIPAGCKLLGKTDQLGAGCSGMLYKRPDLFQGCIRILPDAGNLCTADPYGILISHSLPRSYGRRAPGCRINDQGRAHDNEDGCCQEEKRGQGHAHPDKEGGYDHAGDGDAAADQHKADRRKVPVCDFSSPRCVMI
jgi:hypothetical protein